MELSRITSRQNKAVRAAAALAADPALRRGQRRFLCEGARLCADAARSGAAIEVCYCTAQALEKYRAYLQPVLAAAREAFLVEEHVAQLLSSTKNAQGVFCVCGWPQSLSQEGLTAVPKSSFPVLENLQDPGNLGTVLRTAEALGVRQVCLLGDCCDPLSPKVLRASMGAVFRVGIFWEHVPARLAERLHGWGYTLHAAVPDASARPVTAIDFSAGAHAVCIGNEGSGLTQETLTLCDSRVTIPMPGRAESLNASAAATILLWEMQRGGAAHG